MEAGAEQSAADTVRMVTENMSSDGVHRSRHQNGT